jgi:arginine exporter protein ArgO
VRLSTATQRTLFRTGNAVIGAWLFIVLLAYAGVLKLHEFLADAALLTVLVIIANMIWKYAVQPLFGARRERS